MVAVPPLRILWDLEDDPAGNVQHIADHGITMNEVEDVLRNPECIDASRSSGHGIAIGEACTGRTLVVVYEEVDEMTVYPITAYDIED